MWVRFILSLSRMQKKKEDGKKRNHQKSNQMRSHHFSSRLLFCFYFLSFLLVLLVFSAARFLFLRTKSRQQAGVRLTPAPSVCSFVAHRSHSPLANLLPGKHLPCSNPPAASRGAGRGQRTKIIWLPVSCGSLFAPHTGVLGI